LEQLLGLLLTFLISTNAFECGDEIGVVPDPDDCRSFYICDYEGYDHFQCEEGYLFDTELMVCNYESQVDCGDRPIPGVSTTSTTTTTTEVTLTTKTTTITTTMTTNSSTTSEDITTPFHTTTTETTTTTTSGDHNLRFPDKVMAMYILLCDDTEEGYETDADWDPKLYPYQQEGANVLFFTFIHPKTMKVPKSFDKLAATRGTDAEGAIPKDTVIIFAIGGILYSTQYNPWHWLTSKEAAEDMAVQVANWKCDGIDLDIEEGAGDASGAGQNLVHFVNKLRSIRPNIIIGQPTYGYPAVRATNYVINHSWDVSGNSLNGVDSVGIMVYEGTESLRYVKNFVNGADQWEGFPINVNVNSKAVMVGCKGSASAATIQKLAEESVKQDLLGIMVWYASVQNGLQYTISWDASLVENSQQGYIDALQYFNQH